jgi:hypothetical protein
LQHSDGGALPRVVKAEAEERVREIVFCRHGIEVTLHPMDLLMGWNLTISETDRLAIVVFWPIMIPKTMFHDEKGDGPKVK